MCGCFGGRTTRVSMRPLKETEHALLGARGLGHSRFNVFRAWRFEIWNLQGIRAPVVCCQVLPGCSCKCDATRTRRFLMLLAKSYCMVMAKRAWGGRGGARSAPICKTFWLSRGWGEAQHPQFAKQFACVDTCDTAPA